MASPCMFAMRLRSRAQHAVAECAAILRRRYDTAGRQQNTLLVFCRMPLQLWQPIMRQVVTVALPHTMPSASKARVHCKASSTPAMLLLASSKAMASPADSPTRRSRHSMAAALQAGCSQHPRARCTGTHTHRLCSAATPSTRLLSQRWHNRTRLHPLVAT